MDLGLEVGLDLVLVDFWKVVESEGLDRVLDAVIFCTGLGVDLVRV